MVRLPGGEKGSFPTMCHDKFWDPPSIQFDGQGRVEQAKNDADHFPPSSAEVKPVAILSLTPTSPWPGTWAT